jgi:hypothetical protein
MTIPPDYASVSIEKICQPYFEELELDIVGADGEKTLKDALHGIILWPKRYIVIIPENDGSPREHLESGLPSSVPSREPLQSSPQGFHHHYLLAHLLLNNHTTIQVNGAPAITMMTSLPIHLSNHSPQALECNLSGWCNHQRKNENNQQRKKPR